MGVGNICAELGKTAEILPDAAFELLDFALGNHNSLKGCNSLSKLNGSRRGSLPQLGMCIVVKECNRELMQSRMNAERNERSLAGLEAM